MPVKSMKMTKKEAKDRQTLVAESPEFPYGLQIHLENESIEKLDMKDLPKVGDEMVILGKVKVTSVSAHDSQDGGEQRSVGLQITDMGLTPNDDKKIKSAGEKLYG